jgi:hypothetical protein
LKLLFDEKTCEIGEETKGEGRGVRKVNLREGSQNKSIPSHLITLLSLIFAYYAKELMSFEGWVHESCHFTRKVLEATKTSHISYLYYMPFKSVCKDGACV